MGTLLFIIMVAISAQWHWFAKDIAMFANIVRFYMKNPKATKKQYDAIQEGKDHDTR